MHWDQLYAIYITIILVGIRPSTSSSPANFSQFQHWSHRLANQLFFIDVGMCLCTLWISNCIILLTRRKSLAVLY